MRDEVHAFMKQGNMTKENMFKCHREFNGQTISDAEME